MRLATRALITALTILVLCAVVSAQTLGPKKSKERRPWLCGLVTAAVMKKIDGTHSARTTRGTRGTNFTDLTMQDCAFSGCIKWRMNLLSYQQEVSDESQG